MPNALVHIGMHKSGSSYLQTLMRENAARYADTGVAAVVNVKRDMLAYTQTARRASRRGMALPRLSFPDLQDRIEAAGDRHLFLSCESLENLCAYPEAFTTFRDWLEAQYDRVTFLLVVRNAVDFLNSRVQQRIKRFYQPDYTALGRMGESYALDEKYAALLAPGVPLAFAAFETLIKGETPDELAKLVAQHLGPEIPVADVPAANTSIGATGVAIALCLNFLIRETLGGPIPKDWQRRGRVSTILQAALRDSGLTGDRFNAFDPAAQAGIVAAVEAQGAAFLDRFGERIGPGFLKRRETPPSLTLISDRPADERAAIDALIGRVWDEAAPVLAREFGVTPAKDPRPMIDRFCEGEAARVGL